MRLGDENMAMKTKNGNPITIQSGTAKITLDNGRITITGDSVEFKATQGFKVAGHDRRPEGRHGDAARCCHELQGPRARWSTSSADGIAEIKGTLLKLN